ncbi:uncharacterized protein DS421_18g626930 [Arachis hypogaea]|nr:uncharacterized protein DS421_18g626930 [Arachis hypogaea]
MPSWWPLPIAPRNSSFAMTPLPSSSSPVGSRGALDVTELISPSMEAMAKMIVVVVVVVAAAVRALSPKLRRVGVKRAKSIAAE